LNSLGETAIEVARKRHSDVGNLVKQLRGDLEWITLKAIEKDRTRRYASASEFSADIQRHLTDEPVLASPPSTLYRLKKLARRHRGKVAASVLVGLILIAGFIVSSLLYARAE